MYKITKKQMLNQGERSLHFGRDDMTSVEGSFFYLNYFTLFYLILLNFS